MTSPSLHLSVRIERPIGIVRAYLGDPSNMKEWAAGLATGLERRPDGVWIGKGPGDSGWIEVRFAEPNHFGIADHTVTLESGEVVHVPLRAIANDDGSEVIFTLFRRPTMTDAELAADRAAVEKDLATLKRRVEAS